MKMPSMAGASADKSAMAPKPKAASKSSGASTQVADVKARARNMLKTGAISQKQHDGLVAKADKVAAALGAEGMATE